MNEVEVFRKATIFLQNRDPSTPLRSAQDDVEFAFGLLSMRYNGVMCGIFGYVGKRFQARDHAGLLEPHLRSDRQTVL